MTFVPQGPPVTGGLVRLEPLDLVSDARNERSRAALAKTGARFEGVLRNAAGPWVRGEKGRPRDSAVCSITDEEWPACRDTPPSRLKSPSRPTG